MCRVLPVAIPPSRLAIGSVLVVVNTSTTLACLQLQRAFVGSSDLPSSRHTRPPACPAPAFCSSPRAEAELLEPRTQTSPPPGNATSLPPSHPSPPSSRRSAALCLSPGYCSHPTRSLPRLRRHRSSSPRRSGPFLHLPWTTTRQPERDAAVCLRLASLQHRRPNSPRPAVRHVHARSRYSISVWSCRRRRPTTRSHSTSSTHHSRTTAFGPARRAAFCRRHRTDNGAVNAPASHSLRSVPAPVTLSASRPHVRAPFALCPLLQRPPRSMRRIPTFLARPNIPHLSHPKASSAP